MSEKIVVADKLSFELVVSAVVGVVEVNIVVSASSRVVPVLSSSRSALLELPPPRVVLPPLPV